MALRTDWRGGTEAARSPPSLAPVPQHRDSPTTRAARLGTAIASHSVRLSAPEQPPAFVLCRGQAGSCVTDSRRGKARYQLGEWCAYPPVREQQSRHRPGGSTGMHSLTGPDDAAGWASVLTAASHVLPAERQRRARARARATAKRWHGTAQRRTPPFMPSRRPAGRTATSRLGASRNPRFLRSPAGRPRGAP